LEYKLKQLSGDLETASATGQVARVRTLGEEYTTTQAALDTKLREWEALIQC
jgi:hypothetical protein